MHTLYFYCLFFVLSLFKKAAYTYSINNCSNDGSTLISSFLRYPSITCLNIFNEDKLGLTPILISSYVRNTSLSSSIQMRMIPKEYASHALPFVLSLFIISGDM